MCNEFGCDDDCRERIFKYCQRCGHDRVYVRWYPEFDRAAQDRRFAEHQEKLKELVEQYEKQIELFERELAIFESLPHRQQKKLILAGEFPIRPRPPGANGFYHHPRTTQDPEWDVEHMWYKCSACCYEWREAVS